MRKFITLTLASLLAVAGAYATEYGAYKTVAPVRYTVTAGEINIYDSPDMNSRKMGKMSGGDIIYVDKDNRITDESGRPWIKISGEEKYVFGREVTVEKNPNYVVRVQKNAGGAVSKIFSLGFYDLPKWLGWTLLVVWFILAVVGSCIFVTLRDLSFIGLRRYPGKCRFHSNLDYKYFGDEKFHKSYGFDESTVKQQTDLIQRYGAGMRKILFFNSAPYVNMLLIAAGVLAAFVATILLFFVLGGLTWLLSWVLNIVVMVLFWIFIVIGWIGLAGVLALFDDDKGEGCLISIAGLAIFGLSRWVWSGKEGMEAFCQKVGDFGSSVLSTFNLFGMSWYLVKTYWITALGIALTPIVVFLILALVFMIFAGALRLYESIVMKSYNVKHPCPNCQHPSEPATYLSHGYDLPVALRPGPWGLFSITHPLTGEKMPTLFLNGKDRLERRCAHCDSIISAEAGSEKHVAVAGVTASGKTTLLYRLASEIIRKGYGNFTDDLGAKDTELKAILGSISTGGKMTIFPDKSNQERHKSLQLSVVHPSSPVPYRLFLSDVAGEMFTAEDVKKEDAAFLRNTDVLVFVVDPFTMNISDLNLSDRMTEWCRDNRKSMKGGNSLKEATEVLTNLVKEYRDSKSARKIDLMLTLVKTDSGYLEGVDVNDNEALKEFMKVDLGLDGVIHDLETVFTDISYNAVSATENVAVSGIGNFMTRMFDNLGMSLKNVTAEVRTEARLKAREREAKINAENERFRNMSVTGYYEKCHKDFWDGANMLLVVSIFAAALILVPLGMKINSGILKGNFKKAEYVVDNALKSGSYENAMNTLNEVISGTRLREEDMKALIRMRNELNISRQREIDGMMSILYSNLVAPKGRLSNAEISAKYKALDNLKKLKENIDKLGEITPEDAEYLGYKSTFESILKKYNISL